MTNSPPETNPWFEKTALALASCAFLVAAYLFLPPLFFYNALLWLASSTLILGGSYRILSKMQPRRPMPRKIYLWSLLMTFVAAVIPAFLVKFPFWITAPDQFCNEVRAKAKICSLESEITRVDRQDYLPIYIVGHGWHTGLMLRREDLSLAAWAADLDLNSAKAVEIGWGDAGFYRATEYTFTLAFEAFVLPTPSVLHIVKLAEPIESNFPHSDLYVFWASRSDYQRMLEFVGTTFMKNSSGDLVDAGKGIYGNSRFYLGREPFQFPKSCNGWVASALVAAGAPIWPAPALTAPNILHQIELVGEIIRKVPGHNFLPN